MDEARKKARGLIEQSKSERTYSLEKARRTLHDAKVKTRALMKKRLTLLEGIADEQKKRPMTISEAEKAAIIILEKDLYKEKEVQKALEYLDSHLDELDEANLDSADALKVGMILGKGAAAIITDQEEKPPVELSKTKTGKIRWRLLRDENLVKYADWFVKTNNIDTSTGLKDENSSLWAVLQDRRLLSNVTYAAPVQEKKEGEPAKEEKKKPEKIPEEEKEKIREKLREAAEYFKNRSALAIYKRTLFHKAVKAGVIDEFYPLKERGKMGDFKKKVLEIYMDEEKLIQMCRDNKVATMKDFICRLEDGSQAYAHKRFDKKLLIKVLDKINSEKTEEAELHAESRIEESADPKPAEPEAPVETEQVETQQVEKTTVKDRVEKMLRDFGYSDDLEDALKFISEAGIEHDWELTEELTDRIENEIFAFIDSVEIRKMEKEEEEKRLESIPEVTSSKLSAVLQPLLGDLAVPVSESILTLDNTVAKKIVLNPDKTYDIIYGNIGDLVSPLTKHGITPGKLLSLLNPKGNIGPVNGNRNGSDNSIKKLKFAINYLSDLSVKDGMKTSELERIIKKASCFTISGTGAGIKVGGHRLIYYKDEVVRDHEGVRRYFPNPKDYISGVIAKEIVNACKIFLEKKLEKKAG